MSPAVGVWGQEAVGGLDRRGRANRGLDLGLGECRRWVKEMNAT